PLEKGGPLGIVRGDDDRRRHRPLDGRRIATDLRAISLEDLGLVSEYLETEREPMGHVRVLGGDLQRPLLATAAHQDAWPTRLDWPRDVEGFLDPVVATLEARPLLAE